MEGYRQRLLLGDTSVVLNAGVCFNCDLRARQRPPLSNKVCFAVCINLIEVCFICIYFFRNEIPKKKKAKSVESVQAVEECTEEEFGAGCSRRCLSIPHPSAEISRQQPDFQHRLVRNLSNIFQMWIKHK